MTQLAQRPDLEEGVDQELVEQARDQLNTDSSAEAINTALRELVEARRERRLRAFDEIQRMVADGELDVDAIERSRE